MVAGRQVNAAASWGGRCHWSADTEQPGSGAGEEGSFGSMGASEGSPGRWFGFQKRSSGAEKQSQKKETGGDCGKLMNTEGWEEKS